MIDKNKIKVGSIVTAKVGERDYKERIGELYDRGSRRWDVSSLCWGYIFLNWF